jgi:peroxiredoxin
MSMTVKLAAGSPFPAVAMPRLGGGEVAPASGNDWRLFIVYRGRHCPLCKIYLKTLNELMDEFSAIGVSVMVASGDPEEKAAACPSSNHLRLLCVLCNGVSGPSVD